MTMHPNTNINKRANLHSVNTKLQTASPANAVIKYDFVRLNFSLKQGISDVLKTDSLTDVPAYLRKIARDTLFAEVNAKMSQIKLNPLCFGWLFVFFVLMAVGVVGSAFMFPYTLIFIGLGLAVLIGFLVLAIVKVRNRPKFLRNACAQVYFESNGDLILEPIMKTEYYYSNSRQKKGTKCTGFLLRYKNSKMTLERLKVLEKDPVCMKNFQMIRTQVQQLTMLNHQKNIDQSNKVNPNIHRNYAPNQPVPGLPAQNFNNFQINSPKTCLQNLIPILDSGKLSDPFDGQIPPLPPIDNLHVVQGNGVEIEEYDKNQKSFRKS